MHFNATWNTDKRCLLCLRARRLERLDDVPCGSITARIEDRLNTGIEQLTDQVSRILRSGA